MDSLRNPVSEDTLVVYALDEGGTIRGFLHFVPTYGRDAVSLSYMRRQRETPNGLTEFLIAEGIEHLRVRGVTEVSLNFAAFARLIRQPSGFVERALGRALALGDAWFQIERLYRFNAKFFPRLGAALLHVRAPARPAEGRYRRALARGPAAEAENLPPRARERLSRPTGACGTPPSRPRPYARSAARAKRGRSRAGSRRTRPRARPRPDRRGRSRARRRTTRRRGAASPQPPQPTAPMRIGARCSRPSPPSATASAMSNPTQATSQWWLVCRAGSR